MVVTIPIASDVFTVDQLVDVYRIFCEAFELDATENDAEFLRSAWDRRMRSRMMQQPVEYTPDGITLFSANPKRHEVSFSGAMYDGDPGSVREEADKIQRFELAVRTYATQQLGLTL